MPHSHNKKLAVLGYLILAIVLIVLSLIYQPRFYVENISSIITVMGLATAIAIVNMTISVFWLWQDSRVKFLEKYLGPIGHVMHCGYCMALWLSVIATGLLGISFFSNFNTYLIIDFLLTWWSLSFLSFILFEFIAVIWFEKLKSEFVIREHYRKKLSQN